MGRAGRHARRTARQLRFAFLGAHRRAFVLWLVAVGAIALVLDVVLPVSIRGYAVGSFLTGGLAVLWVAPGAATGAWNVEMGAFAEESTRDDLRLLERHGFEIFESVPGDGYDIDLVAVGPGHVYAFEVKWSTRRWRLEDPAHDSVLRAHLYDARRGTRRIQRVVRPAGVEQVEAVLVLQGPGAESLAPVVLEGVTVIPAAWVRADFRSLLNPSGRSFDVAAATSLIDAYASRLESFERRRAGPRPARTAAR